jgi:hypothetical protein
MYVRVRQDVFDKKQVVTNLGKLLFLLKLGADCIHAHGNREEAFVVFEVKGLLCIPSRQRCLVCFKVRRFHDSHIPLFLVA